jgi:hypothetical protein
MSTPTSPPPPEQNPPFAPPSAPDQPSITQEGTTTVPDESDAVVRPPGESETAPPHITDQGASDGPVDRLPDGESNIRKELPLSKLGL